MLLAICISSLEKCLLFMLSAHFLSGLFLLRLLNIMLSSVAQSCLTLRPHEPQHALSINNSWSPPKPVSIESVMPSNHLILCRPLLLLPSIFPSIKVFSNESALCIRWPKDWRFSFSIPMNIQDLFPLEWTGWISL